MIGKKAFATQSAVALVAASTTCALLLGAVAVLPQPKQGISVAEQREFDRLLWNAQSIIEAYPQDVGSDSIGQIKVEAALLESALGEVEAEPTLINRIHALFGGESGATARQAESSAENTLTAALELFEQAGALRQSVEDQYPHAGIQAVKGLRGAAERLGKQHDIDASSVAAVNAFADAVEQMRVSDQGRQHPAGYESTPIRYEIEAFARELAGENVLLEFEWVPLLLDSGVPGGAAGMVPNNFMNPGEAKIYFTDSLVDHWPSDTAKSLVAHEVGHAIGTYCTSAYDASDWDSGEMFATAWAMSQGFTDENGNGAWLYGRPSDGYVRAVGALCTP